MSDEQAQGEAIKVALSATRSREEDLEEAVITKFAAVVEWMTPGGDRWLSLVDEDSGGERLQRWDVQGMFFNVLHDPAWQQDDEDGAE
jgi:hypothetical protein